MPFTSTTFNSGAAPGIDASSLNNMQVQYTEAVNSFEQDFLSAFVLSGFTAAKDGTVATQLDVAAGVAFPLQTDGTLRRRSANALTYSTVGHASTTMYLDLNPDGTWSWNTAHSAVANYLPICSVTTDASANISTVTDARNLKPTMLGSAVSLIFQSTLGFNRTLSSANQLMDWQQNFGLYSDNTASIFTGGTNRLWFSATGTNGTQEMHFGPRAGSTTLAGARFLTANFWLDGTGAPTVGTFAVKGGITTSLDAGAITTDGSGALTAATFVGALKDSAGAASAINAHDTGTTMQFKPTAANRGLLFSSRDSGGVLHNGMTIDTSGNTTMSGNASVTGTSSLDNGAITTDGSGNVGFTLGPTLTSRQSGALNGFTFLTWSGTAGINALSVGGDLSNSYLVSIDPTGVLYLGGGGTGSGIITPKHSGATANGLTFQSWTGAALVAPLSIGGQFHSALSWFDNSGNLNGGAGTGLPVTRNNAAGSVPIYTGTTAPTSPPTGAIWIDA